MLIIQKSKVKLLNNQKNIYVGNYIKLIYEITDEFENKRVVDYWNYDKALRYFSNVEVDIKSNNERVKIDLSNNILAVEEGNSTITASFDGISDKIDLKIQKIPFRN